MLFTGIDIVKVERISLLFNRYGEKFLKRLFSEEERSYCLIKKDFLTCLAGKFAAKEAVIKALGLREVSYKKIEIINVDDVPKLRLNGEIVNKASISVSHERDYAVGLCVYWEEEIWRR